MRCLRKWLFAGMLLLLLGVLAIGASAATVAEGTCGADGDNLTWVLDDTGTLTISGTGAMRNYDYNSYGGSTAPWNYYREEISEVVFTDTVTSIGKYAFYSCSGLTDIVFPDSLSSIGDKAFYYCSMLTTANFNGNAPEMGSDVFASTHEDFTIYYNPNTTGWSSPEWNGYPAYPYGDTNCDTEITDTDALYLLRHTLLPERYPLRGAWFDFNNDGIVNFRDAVYLLRHVLMPDDYPLYR